MSFLIGVATLFLVQGKAENFFVAGRSLPLWIICFTLASQSIDSNALLGNVDLSYKYQFWDGAVLPIGLGTSLILNGVLLAGKINRDYKGVLTLPDILAKRYGKIVEVLVSIATIISFMMLLAGNLVGMFRNHIATGQFLLFASLQSSTNFLLSILMFPFFLARYGGHRELFVGHLYRWRCVDCGHYYLGVHC